MNVRQVTFAQKLRIYCDYDGTLTRFSGSQTWKVYQADARDNPGAYPADVHVIRDEATRGTCYATFLQRHEAYQLLPDAQQFIQTMLDNPMVEFVIVSRSYKEMIGAALELAGIDGSRVTILDINNLGFEQSKSRSVSDHEIVYPSKGPLLFIDDTAGDALKMKSVFVDDTEREKTVLIAAPGQFNFSDIAVTVEGMLAGIKADMALLDEASYLSAWVGNGSLWQKKASVEPASAPTQRRGHERPFSS